MALHLCTIISNQNKAPNKNNNYVFYNKSKFFNQKETLIKTFKLSS